MIKVDMNTDKYITFNPVMQLTSFAGNVDASRNNMAAKYWNQCVPFASSKNPYVVSPDAVFMATDSDHFKKWADQNTIILYRGNDIVIMYLVDDKEIVTQYLPDYTDAAGASYKLYYFNENQKINKGDLIWSYAPIDHKSKIPKYGHRVKCAFMPFFGFTTEDSYVISESFTKRAKISFHEKLFIPITKQLKYYKQFENESFIPKIGTMVSEIDGIYKYIPIEQSKNLTSMLADMEDIESQLFAKTIAPKNPGYVTKIKVHKIKEPDLKAELLVNKQMLTELENAYQKNYNETLQILQENLKIIPDEESREKLIQGIMDTHIFMKKLHPSQITNRFKKVFDDIELSEVNYIIEIDIAANFETQYGDKFTSMYAGKGTVGLIIPDKYAPKGPDGKPFDIYVNPLSKFGRNNWGVFFELNAAKIIEDIEKYILDNNEHESLRRIEFIFDNLYKVDQPEIYKKKDEYLKYIVENWVEFRNEIEKNGLTLYMNTYFEFTYNEFINKVVIPYEQEFNINIRKKDKIIIKKETIEWLQSIDLDSGCIEPEDTEIDVLTGNLYYMKLYHTAASKAGYGNISDGYTISGQPTRGKSGKGGSGSNGAIGSNLHLSWQTANAFLSAGVTDIMKELYTIKSDALKDKQDFLVQSLKDKYVLKDKYHGKTKESIDSYLKMVGLKFDDK